MMHKEKHILWAMGPLYKEIAYRLINGIVFYAMPKMLRRPKIQQNAESYFKNKFKN